jgi:predicted N-formylglutamate amidohydrolase
VRAHGASVHGFTPVWYSRERIARIAAIADVAIIPMPW